jgi:hypothetical protein
MAIIVFTSLQRPRVKSQQLRNSSLNVWSIPKVFQHAFRLARQARRVRLLTVHIISRLGNNVPLIRDLEKKKKLPSQRDKAFFADLLAVEVRDLLYALNRC